MTDYYYFDDLHAGQEFDLGTRTVSAEEIIAFARDFDPQPFHLDAEKARESIFGSLVASGWHTAGLFMRLLVDGLLSKSASEGSPGVDEIRWLRPVHPGDVLRGRYYVVERRTSKSRPDIGIIRGRGEMYNQDNELVYSMSGIGFFGRRP